MHIAYIHIRTHLIQRKIAKKRNCTPRGESGHQSIRQIFSGFAPPSSDELICGVPPNQLHHRWTDKSHLWINLSLEEREGKIADWGASNAHVPTFDPDWLSSSSFVILISSRCRVKSTKYAGYSKVTIRRYCPVKFQSWVRPKALALSISHSSRPGSNSSLITGAQHSKPKGGQKTKAEIGRDPQKPSFCEIHRRLLLHQIESILIWLKIENWFWSCISFSPPPAGPLGMSANCTTFTSDDGDDDDLSIKLLSKMQDDKWIVMRMVIFDVLDFCSIDRCDTMRVVFCLLTSTEVGIGQQDEERGELWQCSRNLLIVTLMPLWSLCFQIAVQLIVQSLSWSGEGKIEKPSSIFKIRRVSDRKSVGLSLSEILSCVFDPTGRFGRCPRNFYYFKPSTAKNWHKHHISVSRCDVFLGQIVFGEIPPSYKDLPQVSWFQGIYGMSSGIGWAILHNLRDIIDRGWEKCIDPHLVVLQSFLGHKVWTGGLTFLSIRNLGEDHQF